MSVDDAFELEVQATLERNAQFLEQSGFASMGGGPRQASSAEEVEGGYHWRVDLHGTIEAAAGVAPTARDAVCAMFHALDAEL